VNLLIHFFAALGMATTVLATLAAAELWLLNREEFTGLLKDLWKDIQRKGKQ
jgi:hypothetical protein